MSKIRVEIQDGLTEVIDQILTVLVNRKQEYGNVSINGRRYHWGVYQRKGEESMFIQIYTFDTDGYTFSVSIYELDLTGIEPIII